MGDTLDFAMVNWQFVVIAALSLSLALMCTCACGMSNTLNLARALDGFKRKDFEIVLRCAQKLESMRETGDVDMQKAASALVATLGKIADVREATSTAISETNGKVVCRHERWRMNHDWLTQRLQRLERVLDSDHTTAGMLATFDREIAKHLDDIKVDEIS